MINKIHFIKKLKKKQSTKTYLNFTERTRSEDRSELQEKIQSYIKKLKEQKISLLRHNVRSED